jgi:hypothetical protein
MLENGKQKCQTAQRGVQALLLLREAALLARCGARVLQRAGRESAVVGPLDRARRHVPGGEVSTGLEPFSVGGRRSFETPEEDAAAGGARTRE